MSAKISVIIPAYNEAAVINRLIDHLQKHGGENLYEIIVSDAGSTDNTDALAADAGALVFISPQKGRAAQMNHAVSHAGGNIYYFVHADTLPPATFSSDIANAVKDGYHFGRYRTKFDSSNLLLKINAWFTRFDWFICYGGDQTLFIEKEFYHNTGGFNANLQIMEEYEYCDRVKNNGRYKIFNEPALVSARKYEGRSWLQVQRANRLVVRAFKAGKSQDEIINNYKKMLG